MGNRKTRELVRSGAGRDWDLINHLGTTLMRSVPVQIHFLAGVTEFDYSDYRFRLSRRWQELLLADSRGRRRPVTDPRHHSVHYINKCNCLSPQLDPAQRQI